MSLESEHMYDYFLRQWFEIQCIVTLCVVAFTIVVVSILGIIIIIVAETFLLVLIFISVQRYIYAYNQDTYNYAYNQGINLSLNWSVKYFAFSFLLYVEFHRIYFFHDFMYVSTSLLLKHNCQEPHYTDNCLDVKFHRYDRGTHYGYLIIWLPRWNEGLLISDIGSRLNNLSFSLVSELNWCQGN